MNDLTRESNTRKTKIVTTIGPASDSPDAIQRLIQHGANVFRLNFSHGTERKHRETIAFIRAQSGQMGVTTAIIQDLQGPRLRTGKLADSGGTRLKAGSTATITPGNFDGDADRIATDYADLPNDVTPHARILISDGLLELKVSEINGMDVVCKVISGGLLRENQGINLPDSELSITPPTPKDIADLGMGIECGVDYVALSFVSSASELHVLRDQIESLRSESAPAPGIIAKIERPQAVSNIDSIIEASDAIMVARGDLGIEMKPEEVPQIQKMLINSANEAAIPVITATQMLESMIKNPRPTRAEASDVANAILDGSDAVMLSGETAIGEYAAESVEMMARIATKTEVMLNGEEKVVSRHSAPNHTCALARAACRVARQLDARALVAFTMTGATARYAARQRSGLPIYALTPIKSTQRRLALVWGVNTLTLPLLENTDDMISIGMERLREENLAAAGDTMVCIAGPSTGTAGGTDMLQLLHF